MLFLHLYQFVKLEAIVITTRVSFLERGTKNNPLYFGSGTGYQNILVVNDLIGHDLLHAKLDSIISGTSFLS